MAAKKQSEEGVKRRPLLLPETSPYFSKLGDKDLPFVSSGCGLLDCMYGGGMVLGRIINIVGDRSSGKTLLAIEAVVNFVLKYKSGQVRYLEAEAAFDEDYAEALGMPVDQVSFAREFDTVEHFFKDLDSFLDKLGTSTPGLYVVDSLDALSDTAEMLRDTDKGSFGAAKAKKMSEGFRRVVRRLESSRCLLVVISQVRENIGVTFGAKYTRSGGKALDFYASQIIWLADMGKLKRTIQGIERVEGIKVKARSSKNKIGLPFREAQFPILFGYGVDDVTASIDWLFLTAQEVTKDGKKLKLLPPVLDEYRLTGSDGASVRKLRDQGAPALLDLRQKLDVAVIARWREIEAGFLPKAGKYS